MKDGVCNVRFCLSKNLTSCIIVTLYRFPLNDLPESITLQSATRSRSHTHHILFLFDVLTSSGCHPRALISFVISIAVNEACGLKGFIFQRKHISVFKSFVKFLNGLSLAVGLMCLRMKLLVVLGQNVPLDLC